MRNPFRRTLNGQRACRIARRHVDHVCAHRYPCTVEECTPLATPDGAYLVRCEVFEWTYYVGVAPNGDVVAVERCATAKAAARG